MYICKQCAAKDRITQRYKESKYQRIGCDLCGRKKDEIGNDIIGKYVYTLPYPKFLTRPKTPFLNPAK